MIEQCNTIIQGDALEVLKTLPDGIVQTCVTSPPYYGLRDYGTGQWTGGSPECDHINRVMRPSDRSTLERHGTDGRSPQLDALPGIPYSQQCGKCGATRIDQQIGLEESPEAYITRLVEVFREVKRVLRDDGTLWVNIGDSFWGGKGQSGQANPEYQALRKDISLNKPYHQIGGQKKTRPTDGKHDIIKPKDLIGIPWMLAFALRADGWYLRSDIIWAKSNCMPESVTDRPTKSHEYIFLLSKSERYFYDADAIRETHRYGSGGWQTRGQLGLRIHGNGETAQGKPMGFSEAGRNKRSVWTVSTSPYSEAHFATFPPKLIEPCILAGTSPRACEHCGAPWERVTERIQFGKASSETKFDKTMQGGPLSGSRQAYRAMGLEGPPSPITTGWRPTCSHTNEGTAQSIVLDPFSGAGTALMVASQLGRSWLGIELNPEYITLARKRMSVLQVNLWEAVS